jgi:hypothetical protein
VWRMCVRGWIDATIGRGGGRGTANLQARGFLVWSAAADPILEAERAESLLGGKAGEDGSQPMATAGHERRWQRRAEIGPIWLMEGYAWAP